MPHPGAHPKRLFTHLPGGTKRKLRAEDDRDLLLLRNGATLGEHRDAAKDEVYSATRIKNQVHVFFNVRVDFGLEQRRDAEHAPL